MPAHSGRNPLRILAFLDDTVVSGNVKPVLALARFARGDLATPRPLDFSMVVFVRSDSDPAMVTALRDEGFVVDVIRERHRFDFGVFAQLRGIVERRSPQILWTHGTKPHFLVRAAGLQRDRAWIAFHHGFTATSLAWKIYGNLDRWSLRGANRLMAPCEAFARELNERFGLSLERISVHPSPLVPRIPEVNSKGQLAREHLGVRNSDRVVLSVGRLSKEKGHADLVQAMQRVVKTLPDTALLIVGDGPERQRLAQLSRQLGLESHISFLGYRNDVAPYYAAADVFALTSHTEGSPNVLLEAMEANVPIVATAVGGVGEMIVDGEHGLLVRRGDVEAIADAILALLGDAALREALACRAHKSLTAYSLDKYYAGIRRQFESVLPSNETIRRRPGAGQAAGA